MDDIVVMPPEAVLDSSELSKGEIRVPITPTGGADLGTVGPTVDRLRTLVESTRTGDSPDS